MIKLTFFMFNNLMDGKGTANVLFNLLKNKPENIETAVIITDYVRNKRISEETINNNLKGSDVIKIKKHKKVNKDGAIWRFINNFIIKNNITDLKNVKKNKNLYEKIRDTDIVYLFYNPYSIFFDNMDIPVIGSTHGEDLKYITSMNLYKNIYFKLYYKMYYKNINGFHIFRDNNNLSNTIKATFGTEYNMVLPNGIDTSLFHPDYDVKNKKLRLFFVASLKYGKGLDILMPLIDKFSGNNEVEFHIAGGGPMENQIKNNENIIYHGIVNNNELSELYNKSDIFIYPSHNDTFSMVTLEALSSGLYVLCSDYLKGNFDDFENKYLEYLPLNVDIWYNRINEITNNRALIGHDKNEEYNYIKDNYDWKIISKKFYDYMVKFYNESRIKK